MLARLRFRVLVEMSWPMRLLTLRFHRSPSIAVRSLPSPFAFRRPIDFHFSVSRNRRLSAQDRRFLLQGSLHVEGIVLFEYCG